MGMLERPSIGREENRTHASLPHLGSPHRRRCRDRLPVRTRCDPRRSPRRGTASRSGRRCPAPAPEPPPPPAYDSSYDTAQVEAPPPPPAGSEIASEAVFYERLSPYGHWTFVAPYGRVWVPAVGYGWRPYYYGPWVLTGWGLTFC